MHVAGVRPLQDVRDCDRDEQGRWVGFLIDVYPSGLSGREIGMVGVLSLPSLVDDVSFSGYQNVGASAPRACSS